AGAGAARAGAVRGGRHRQARPRRTLRRPAPDGDAVPVRGAVHRPGRLRERGVSAARAYRPARGDHPRPGAHEAQRGGAAWRRAPAHLAGLGRHGEADRACARHRPRSAAAALRRAVRGPGPDLARHGGAAHPPAQRRPRGGVRARDPRCPRILRDRRPGVPPRPGEDRRARHAGGTDGLDGSPGRPVPEGRARGTGAVPLSGSAPGERLRRRDARMTRLLDAIARLGAWVVGMLVGMGYGARFFLRLCLLSLRALRRPRLVVDQVHFIGNHSLSIILVSGLFVGFVLGLQGYYTLQAFGSEQALGVLVALSLVRELGPVVAALLFAGRAGTSLTAEIGLMKSGEQLLAMEMMAVDPIARVLAPRFLGAVIAMPLLAAMFSAVGVFGGYLVGVHLIGVDAGSFWSQMQAGVDVFSDVGNG